MPDILIIDDEELIRDSLATVLIREGYTVDTAVNGQEGMEKFEKDPARLIVTDIIMPKMEGIETIKKLREKYTDLKIIVISGGGRAGNLDFLAVAKKLGADISLHKPFSRAQIVQAAKTLMADGVASCESRPSGKEP